MNLRSSTLAAEGALRVSQPIKIPLFLDISEMEHFLHFLNEWGSVVFYDTHAVQGAHSGIYSCSEFLKVYGDYVRSLQRGHIPDRKSYEPFFSWALSITPDIFYQIDLQDHKRIIKAARPPIQLQPHHMTFSSETGSIYSMTYSENSITFGIQLSYPHFFQDAQTHEIMEVDESSFFPNTLLFKKVRSWVRENTLPTPFIINEKKVNVPIRLGKNCFSWINQHPQLQRVFLYVNQRIT